MLSNPGHTDDDKGLNWLRLLSLFFAFHFTILGEMKVYLLLTPEWFLRAMDAADIASKF